MTSYLSIVKTKILFKTDYYDIVLHLSIVKMIFLPRADSLFLDSSGHVEHGLMRAVLSLKRMLNNAGGDARHCVMVVVSSPGRPVIAVLRIIVNANVHK